MSHPHFHVYLVLILSVRLEENSNILILAICFFFFTHIPMVQVRQCLAESEPITFLKCDQACHDKVLGKEETTTPKPLHLKPNKQAKDDEELASVRFFCFRADSISRIVLIPGLFIQSTWKLREGTGDALRIPTLLHAVHGTGPQRG